MGTNNAINVSAAGLVKYDGSSAFSGVTVTQHDLLVGAASNGITSVAPSATSGVPVISQGSSSDPVFGTAVVAGGGTGVTTMTTAYAPVCAGTTATGSLQVASTGLSTSGLPLLSNGSSSLPSFAALSASNVNGSTSGVAPAAGVIGEQIRNTGSVNPSNNSKTNVTSINLTTGIWNVCGIGTLAGSLTGTYYVLAVSATSGQTSTDGDTQSTMPFVSDSNAHLCQSIPPFQVVLGSSATYYLVCQVGFTGGTATVTGRISATRIG